MPSRTPVPADGDVPVTPLDDAALRRAQLIPDARDETLRRALIERTRFDLRRALPRPKKDSR